MENFKQKELTIVGLPTDYEPKQEQERSYSEEEVIAFGEFIFKHSLLTHTRGVKSLFEQFKKK